MEAKIEANNKKFEALRCTLLSRIDIHQARTDHSRRDNKRRWTAIKKRWMPGEKRKRLAKKRWRTV
jgi:hypothetical protein